jgi:hypothetical protein
VLLIRTRASPKPVLSTVNIDNLDSENETRCGFELPCLRYHDTIALPSPHRSLRPIQSCLAHVPARYCLVLITTCLSFNHYIMPRRQHGLDDHPEPTLSTRAEQVLSTRIKKHRPVEVTSYISYQLVLHGSDPRSRYYNMVSIQLCVIHGPAFI